MHITKITWKSYGHSDLSSRPLNEGMLFLVISGHLNGNIKKVYGHSDLKICLPLVSYHILSANKARTEPQNVDRRTRTKIQALYLKNHKKCMYIV